MTRFVDIDSQSADLNQTAADAVELIDIYTPTIENLLRRLAEVHAPERNRQPSFRLRSWAIVAAFLVLLCVPGGAAAPTFLVKARSVAALPQPEQALAKSDQLDRTEAAIPTDNSADDKQTPSQETLSVGDLLEPITFRGSIETTSLTEPAAGPVHSPKRKPKRAAGLLPQPRPSESPQEAPQPLSFLERLFGTSVFVTPTPPQT